MFTHRIDEESNWGGRGESTGVRGAKMRPSHFSVFNWLVRRVWDEKVPEKLRCEWKTSRKHRVNILTAGKHGKLVENHVLCWRCSCQARKGGKVFFARCGQWKSIEKVRLWNPREFGGKWMELLDASCSHLEVESAQSLQILLPFHFFKNPFLRVSLNFRLPFFLCESATSTLSSLVYSKGNPSTRAYLHSYHSTTSWKFPGIVRNFLTLSRFFVSLLISLRNRSENKVRSEKERRKYPCSSTSTASSTEKHV